MTRIQIALRARRDREEALAFLQAPSAAADDFIADLQFAIRHLERFPDTAVARPEFTRRKVVFWLMSPYFLVLERSSEELTLVAILHCSRNIRRELRQRLGKAS